MHVILAARDKIPILVRRRRAKPADTLSPDLVDFPLTIIGARRSDRGICSHRSIDVRAVSNMMNPRVEIAGRIMPRTRVAKRLVFHIGGYDPITPPASAQRRFVREIARFQSTWSAKAIVDGLRDSADQTRWNVTTTGPDWLVETDYHLVRWDDVIDAFRRRTIGSRIPLGIIAFLDFVLAGALWRYLRANWHYAGF